MHACYSDSNEILESVIPNIFSVNVIILIYQNRYHLYIYVKCQYLELYIYLWYMFYQYKNLIKFFTLLVSILKNILFLCYRGILNFVRHYRVLLLDRIVLLLIKICGLYFYFFPLRTMVFHTLYNHFFFVNISVSLLTLGFGALLLFKKNICLIWVVVFFKILKKHLTKFVFMF
jgi:hypothetical protein